MIRFKPEEIWGFSACYFVSVGKTFVKMASCKKRSNPCFFIPRQYMKIPLNFGCTGLRTL